MHKNSASVGLGTRLDTRLSMYAPDRYVVMLEVVVPKDCSETVKPSVLCYLLAVTIM